MRMPRWFWRLIHFGPRVAYAIGLGGTIGRFILLLTTYGRRTGRPRVTPLLYAIKGEAIVIASARGESADWLANIAANPRVRVQLGRRRFEGTAQISREPEEIADFLQSQFDRNPRAFGAIFHAEGLPNPPSRADLLRFAPSRPMVTIRPKSDAA